MYREPVAQLERRAFRAHQVFKELRDLPEQPVSKEPQVRLVSGGHRAFKVLQDQPEQPVFKVRPVFRALQVAQV